MRPIFWFDANSLSPRVRLGVSFRRAASTSITFAWTDQCRLIVLARCMIVTSLFDEGDASCTSWSSRDSSISGATRGGTSLERVRHGEFGGSDANVGDAEQFSKQSVCS